MIKKYLKKFSKLKTYKNRKIWTGVTAYQAPHKPFLLLSVMDLIEQGQIKTNFIEPSFELLDTLLALLVHLLFPSIRLYIRLFPY